MSLFLFRAFWILSLVYGVGALISFVFPGRHTLLAGLKVNFESFEKPLVSALILGALALGVLILRRRSQEETLDEVFEAKKSFLSRTTKTVWILTGIFVVWFFSVNAWRYFVFLQGFDIGTYTNVLANTLEGRWFLESHGRFNMLGEHFMILSLLAVPFLWIWKSSAALILFQSLAVSLSIPALYLIARKKSGSALVALLVLILFLLSPYLHKIMMDPYRPITLAIPIFFWAFYFFEENRKLPFIILLLASFLVQENTPIFVAGLSIFLLLRPGWRLTGAAMLAASVLALFFIMGKLMPWIYGKEKLLHMTAFFGKYEGGNLQEIAWNILKQPWPLFEQIFKPQKIGQIFFFMATVGFLCLGSWKYLFLFLPSMIFYQMSDFFYMINFSRHYSTEPLVGVFFATLCALEERREVLRRVYQKWKEAGWIRYLLVAFVLILLSQYPSYQMSTNLEKVREGYSFLKEIPPKASITTTAGEYYAHLAFREHLSAFPAFRGYDYIFVTKDEAAFYQGEIREIKNGPYDLIREGTHHLLFKKKNIVAR